MGSIEVVAHETARLAELVEKVAAAVEKLDQRVDTHDTQLAVMHQAAAAAQEPRALGFWGQVGVGLTILILGGVLSAGLLTWHQVGMMDDRLERLEQRK